MINAAEPRRVCVSADAIAQPGGIRCSTELKILAQDYKSIRNLQHSYCDVATLIRSCRQNEIADYGTVTLGAKLDVSDSPSVDSDSVRLLILMN